MQVWAVDIWTKSRGLHVSSSFAVA